MKSCTMIAAILYIASVLIIAQAASNVNICSNVQDGIFLADLKNCSSYYVCMNQTAYHQNCQEGLHFTAKTQRCDYPLASTCAKQCTQNLSTFCYDKTCTKYVLCFAGEPIIKQCYDSLQYNAETDRCDFASTVDCRENMCNSVNDPKNLVYLPSQAACDKYYLCYNGEPHPYYCTKGLQFNPANNYCDLKSNVNCTIVANKRTALPYSKEPKIRANIPCPKKGAHFYPHPRPDSYYLCVNGEGVVLTCTPGLFYDKETESCRERKNIK